MEIRRFIAGFWLAAAAQAAPTYTKDVAPILYKNCASCHRPGQVAPFSLLTYRDAAARALQIAAVTGQRYMPPWKPEPGYGHFSNERRLSDADIRTLGEWARAHAPMGNPKDLPPAPVFASGWFAGEPDEALSIPGKSMIAADGPDRFQCFVLPYNADAERFVKSMEFRPGNPRVVHHALVFIDTSGKARKLDQAAHGAGYPCFGGPGFIPAGMLGGWAPGATPAQLPNGLAITIPKGADLVLQIHYHPSGKPETDTSVAGLRFTGAPEKGLTSMVVLSRRIDIPAGDAHYEVKSSLEVPEDVKAIGITPHAHYLCKDMKVTAQLPDGKSMPLIWIKDWDFNWQGQYRFASPVDLPKGTRITLDYIYDNSAANPRNPSNPPRRVTFGEQTTDEMALAFLAVELPSRYDVTRFRREMMLNLFAHIIRERFGFGS